MVFRPIAQTSAEKAPEKTPEEEEENKTTAAKAPEKTLTKSPTGEETTTAPRPSLGASPIIAVFWPRKKFRERFGRFGRATQAPTVRLDGRSGYVLPPAYGFPIGVDLIEADGRVHSHADRLSLDHMVWRNQLIPSNHVSFIFRSKSYNLFKTCQRVKS